MSESNILLESRSPVCDTQAFVEETDRNCYFYLWFYPNSERAYIRECWICNTAPAEDEIDIKTIFLCTWGGAGLAERRISAFRGDDPGDGDGQVPVAGRI